MALELAGRGWRRGTVVWRGGDVTSLAVDTSPRQRIVATFESGAVASGDGGRTWTAADDAGTAAKGGYGKAGARRSAPGLRGEMLCLIALAAEGGVLYAGTTEGVFRSADGGFFWTGAGAGLGDQSVAALAEVGGALVAAVHPNPKGRLAPGAKVEGGRLYRLGPGAARWAAVTRVLGGAPGGFATDPDGERLAWTSRGTVLASSHRGARWTAIARGLPPIHSAVVV